MNDEPNIAPYGNSPREINCRRLKAFTAASLPASEALTDVANPARREQKEEIPSPIGTPAETPSQVIDAFLMAHGVHPKEGDELILWLHEAGFVIVPQSFGRVGSPPTPSAPDASAPVQRLPE